MCGIAGYSCSLEQTEKFGKKRTVRIVRDAIENNMHRGSDAGGWMASTKDEDVKAFKSGGHPLFIVKQKLYPTFDPTALAVHTRAATLGDPKDNKNNHPVFWDGVWTTHNGHIANHEQVKKILANGTPEDDVPEVDSVALSMVISDIMDDPTKGISDKLIAALDDDVRGGFAFATMWVEHPEYVLIGRGSSSPLYVAINDDIVVWSSEQEGVAKITRRFGKLDTSWKHGLVETGAFMLLNRGKVLDFKHYPKRTYQSTSKPATKKRISTKIKNFVCFDNSGYSHWTDEKGPISVNDNVTEKIFKLKEEQFKDFPSGLKQIIGDTDQVFVWIHPKNFKTNGKADFDDIKNRYFILFDDVEIICTYNGTIRDIYNHKGKKSFDDSRWEAIPKDEPKVEVVMSEDEKLRERGFITLTEGDIPLGKVSVYKPKEPIQQQTGGWTSPTTRRYHKDNTTIPKTDRLMVRNNYDPDFVFYKDQMCAEHRQFYSRHMAPDLCEETLAEAASNVLDMTCLNDIIKTYPCKIGHDNWHSKHVHEWEIVGFSAINYGEGADPNAMYEDWLLWSFPYREKCNIGGCVTERFLTEFYWLPGYMKEKEVNALSS